MISNRKGRVSVVKVVARQLEQSLCGGSVVAYGFHRLCADRGEVSPQQTNVANALRRKRSDSLKGHVTILHTLFSKVPKR
jgi:hypothetical protein